MAHSSLDTLSDDALVRLCSDSNPDRTILCSILGGATVVKILGDVVVKFGFGVKESEWKNQEKAFELIKPELVRVPKPYRFFTSGTVGYLVMEYIKGETLSHANAECINRLRDALQHLAHIRSHRPGALGGGPSRGQLWSAYHDFIPTHRRDIEEYYNLRMRRTGKELDLGNLPFVLVHGDIVDRNIIVTDEYIALVDWASAGFYPNFFERCIMRMNFYFSDGSLQAVDEALGSLPDEEEAQIPLLRFACLQSERFIQ